LSETTGKARAARKPSRLVRWSRGRGRRFLFLFGIIVGAVSAYLLGLELAYRDMVVVKQETLRLQSEIDRLKRQSVLQESNLTMAQAKIKSIQAALDEVMPSKDTYIITPNQSMLVAGGRLSIGLIGAPTNASVTMNINGKTQFASSGDTVNVALDSSTTCRVRVESFDMFKATITATCDAARPQ
jgi:hypothetical protein